MIGNSYTMNKEKKSTRKNQTGDIIQHIPTKPLSQIEL